MAPMNRRMTSDTGILTWQGMAWRNLYRQPVRTLLTSIGVAAGVVAVVAFGAVTRGMWNSTNAAIHFADGAMMVFQAGAAADILSTLDEPKVRQFLESDPEVARAIPTLSHIMPVDGMPFFLIMGMHPSDIASHQTRLTDGRLCEGENEVLLGALAARALKKGVGDLVSVGRRTFRVTGIFKTNIVFFDGAVAMPLGHLQSISQKLGQVTSFQVHTKPGADPEVVAARLEQRNPEIFAVVSAEQYKKVDQGLEMANGAVWAISFMAVIIGGIIVANTMWMSVHERTREIGVLRAVGWTRRGIVRMIIMEAGLVGLLAFLLGCLAGAGLAKITTWLPMADRFVQPTFDLQPFAKAFVVALVLSVFGGAIPAWRAARISPVEALRHE